MMEKRVTTGKFKKKMTKEQVQLAITKKKECDAKALKIVERLLEPDVDAAWLMENLKDINRCHMEDVIEERTIVKLCGYVLCQKPITVVYNQRYHISLKDKKVYDITKRKNFCSSSCFGASNYLLEQMLTSPLWMRDKEEIPKFKIFHKEKQGLNIPNADTHGKEVNIAAVKSANQEDATQNVELQDSTDNKDVQLKKGKSQIKVEKEISGCIENFVLETVQNLELKDIDSTVDKTSLSFDNQQNISVNLTATVEDIKTNKKVDRKEVKTNNIPQTYAEVKNHDTNFTFATNELIKNSYRKDTKDKMLENKIKLERAMFGNIDVTEKGKDKCIDDNIIEQCVYPIENEVSHLNSKCSNAFKENRVESKDIIEESSYPRKNRCNESYSTFDLHSTHRVAVAHGIESDTFSNGFISKVKKTKQVSYKKFVDVNLVARVEESFHEWITDQTIDYLFGDESIKKRVIEAIKIQENHRILCGKLDNLQIQEEREDAKILGKTTLKLAPHFAVLKEEGQKLDLKVRAFYEGKSTFEEPAKLNADEGTSHNAETFLPLTDMHAPLIVRQKFFLEKLDHVLPDLLRALAGNNDVYARASLNYNSVKCTAVKALIHTFSLSARNIIFKTAEWTLVGLVIIKMLSLSDQYLESLLATKQANLHISMILAAYKLNSDYLNLLVTSFNPNMNPR